VTNSVPIHGTFTWHSKNGCFSGFNGLFSLFSFIVPSDPSKNKESNREYKNP
jgi:hypothetical protein